MEGTFENNKFYVNGFEFTKQSIYIYKLKHGAPIDVQPEKKDWVRYTTETAENYTVTSASHWNDKNKEWKQHYPRQNMTYVNGLNGTLVNEPSDTQPHPIDGTIWIFGEFSNQNGINYLLKDGTSLSTGHTYLGQDLNNSNNNPMQIFVGDNCEGVDGGYLDTGSFSNNRSYVFGSYNSTLTLIIIGNSIKYLRNQQFSDFKMLHFVKLGSSIESLPKECFIRCTSLSELTIPNSVTSIGKLCFSTCTSLSEITIPNSVTSIGESCFAGCTSLSEITIPNSVTSIGEHCFSGCTNLSEIIIPNSVTSIGKEFFYSCTNLSEISIGNSVETIGERCFLYCTSLSEITIPNSVTTIDSQCFAYCTNLTEVTIGNSVETIGQSCFFGCTSLTTVIISPDAYLIQNNIVSYGENQSLSNDLSTGGNAITVTIRAPQ